MAVDYADRGKPKRKSPQRKRAKSARGQRAPTPSRGKQVRSKALQRRRALSAVVIILIAGFAVFLWLLKAEPDEPTANEELPVLERSAPISKPLPEAPQERWGYIEELENNEVEVYVPEQAEARRRLMQCGSFRQPDDAEALRAAIAMQGFESQVRRSESSEHGVWHRVILGPFPDLRSAQRANNQLRRGEIHGCQIWLWNLD